MSISRADGGFETVQRFDRLDCVNFIDDEYVYASGRNRIYRRHREDRDFAVVAELPLQRRRDGLLFSTKITQRVFRKRIENVVALPSRTIVAAFGGRIYRIPVGRSPEQVFDLVTCRGTLHGGVALTPEGELFLGEYLKNPERGPVKMYRGTADGAEWKLAYASPPKRFRHYHGCFWDPYGECLWFTTGDEEGENFIARTDTSFSDVEYIGDGSKRYSCVNLLFTKDCVYFANDNPLGANHLWRMHRSSKRFEKLATMNGPAWYGTMTSDGCMVFASTVEPCEELGDTSAHLYVSRDEGESWTDVAQWRRDAWVPWGVFQFGVINFPGGLPVRSDDLWMSAQALRGFDLSVVRGRLSPRASAQ
jgi:hypothetical protein